MGDTLCPLISKGMHVLWRQRPPFAVYAHYRENSSFSHDKY